MGFLTGKLGLWLAGGMALLMAGLVAWGLVNKAAAEKATNRAVTAERNFAEADRRAAANARRAEELVIEHAREMREVTEMAVRERQRVATLEEALDEVRNDPTHGDAAAAVLDRALDRLRTGPAPGPRDPNDPGPGPGPAVRVAPTPPAAPAGREPGPGR